MKHKYIAVISLAAILVAVTSVALARAGNSKPTTTLVETVRQATASFQDVKAAQAAGYALLHGCVSGQQDGAMGIHFANGDLVGDGIVDAQDPEALLYEQKGGTLRLVGAEFVVLADAWNAKNQMPPVLMGQLFNYVSTPNRYGLPAFYELHVWSGKSNPAGAFADWNTRVSCEEFVGEHASHGAGH